MPRVLIVGGGYAGFYTAWHLERKLRCDEAEITVVDPRPCMTDQPFLPEVTAGALTRVRPVPGIAEKAIGLKHVEEAVAIRDRLLMAFDRASTLPPGPERARLVTVTFVDGGFTGVEGFAELLSLATASLQFYPGLAAEDLSFHLVEAAGRILPEVAAGPGAWVLAELERRGGRLHLDTVVVSAVDGHVVLSDGREFDSELMVWTAGNAANPVVARHTDLPAAHLRGRRDKNYVHHSLGVLATLGYHLLAVPTAERKIRVLALQLPVLVFGRDIVRLPSVMHPRDAFVAAGAVDVRR